MTPWPSDYREQFWALYPRKVEKKTAMEKLDQVRKSENVEFDKVINGLKRYILWLKHPTEWRPEAKHAATWLNRECWNDELPVAQVTIGTTDQMEIEAAVKMFARIGIWSRYAGPEPGLTGCRASPDLLAKYGFRADGRKLDATTTKVG